MMQYMNHNLIMRVYALVILPVAMCGLLREVGWEIDDADGLVRALLHADAAPDAQRLADLGDLHVRVSRWCVARG